MQQVDAYIREQQARFADHPFFVRLQKAATLDEIMAFAPDLAFWVMAFQDVLRLNESRVDDAGLRRMARAHRIEDAGHERWFLEDLSALGARRGHDAASLFSPRDTTTRDAAYEIVSEVFRVRDDRVRVVLLLALESAGHVFFERVARALEGRDDVPPLRYFAKAHLDVEKDHELFHDADVQMFLEAALPADVRAEAKALVERVYAAFARMFDGFVKA